MAENPQFLKANHNELLFFWEETTLYHSIGADRPLIQRGLAEGICLLLANADINRISTFEAREVENFLRDLNGREAFAWTVGLTTFFLQAKKEILFNHPAVNEINFSRPWPIDSTWEQLEVLEDWLGSIHRQVALPLGMKLSLIDFETSPLVIQVELSVGKLVEKKEFLTLINKLLQMQLPELEGKIVAE